MTALLKIEWLKIKKYPAFWWMLGIVALTYPGINLIFYTIYKGITVKNEDMATAVAKSILGNPFAFPETWHSVAYFSSCFVVIPAILVIMIITNEYTYKTHRQNIIDGWSRNQFVSSKLIDVFIITIVATLMYIATAAGYGFTIKDESTTGVWTDQIQYIPLFFIQTFSQLSIAFLLGFLIKKSFIALGLFVFYAIVLENIIAGYLNLKDIPLSRFLPLEISDKIIPGPSFLGKFNEAKYTQSLALINQQVIYSILLTAAVWAFCYWHYNKRDL